MGVPWDSQLRGWKVIDQQIGEVSVANKTTEETLYSFTIPTDWLTGKESFFRLFMFGLIKQDQTASDMTFRMKLGTTTICTAIAEVANIADEGAFELMMMLAARDGKAQDAMIRVLASRAKAAVAESLMWLNRSAGTVDMTSADRLLDITVQHETANAGIYIKAEHAMLEMLMP